MGVACGSVCSLLASWQAPSASVTISLIGEAPWDCWYCASCRDATIAMSSMGYTDWEPILLPEAMCTVVSCRVVRQESSGGDMTNPAVALTLGSLALPKSSRKMSCMLGLRAQDPSV